MFEPLFLAIETSSLGVAARSSPWLYPIGNLSHVLGAALLVGAITVYDLGVLLSTGASSLRRIALSVAILGFVLVLLGGSVLFSAEATALGKNPVFLFKMAILAVALINVIVNNGLYQMGRVAQLPVCAAISLVAWVAVLLAGRLIAYV